MRQFWTLLVLRVHLHCWCYFDRAAGLTRLNVVTKNVLVVCYSEIMVLPRHLPTNLRMTWRYFVERHSFRTYAARRFFTTLAVFAGW